MAIDRVEIKDFLVFKGEFVCDFCPGVNVIIGGNATGKTTLLKALYAICQGYPLLKYINEKEFGKGKVSSTFSSSVNIDSYFASGENFQDGDLKFEDNLRHVRLEKYTETNGKESTIDLFCGNIEVSVYIPEKDLLSNSMSLPETVKYGNLQFTRCETDIIERARVAPSVPIQPLVEKIYNIINGKVEHDGQSFFVKKYGADKPIPFSMEASGFRKIGLLATLIRNEQIKPGSILFWDEPENSLNPELMPVLVEILFELQRDGVQIFIATHNYNLARWFDVKRDSEKGDKVTFYNLSKSDNGSIECVSAAEYTRLPESILDIADEKLFKAVVADAMRIQEDE